MVRIPHYIHDFSGYVEGGNKIGRKMGIPTVNIRVNDDGNLPQFGVYVATVVDGEGNILKGIANIGRKPTVESYDVDGKIIPNPVGIEVNIFDFDKDIYDTSIKVYFHEFVRPERKFDSFDKLQAQIESDIIKTKVILDKLYEEA